MTSKEQDKAEGKAKQDANVIPMFGKAKPAAATKTKKSSEPTKLHSKGSTSAQTTDKEKPRASTEATTEVSTKALSEDNRAKKDRGMSFSEIMKRNAQNKDRLKKERLKANQKVIRTHRLKH